MQMVRQRSSQGAMADAKWRRQLSVVDWARDQLQLTELRDQMVIMTLSLAMDKVSIQELEGAMGTLAQRIAAVQAARRRAASRGRAAREEHTLPGQAPTTSSGLLRLTQ